MDYVYIIYIHVCNILLYYIIIYLSYYICLIYICSHEKQFALPVITAMALWKLMHLDTWCKSCVQWMSTSCVNHAVHHTVHHTVYHVPKCMSFHKAIVVITGRAHCFLWLHIYYAHLASVRFEQPVFRGSFMITYVFSAGSKPTTSCLWCPRSNHWAIWPNNETCLMVYRIKWSRSSSHR